VERLSGGAVSTAGDHRIAMAAAVLACGARGPIVLDDATVVEKSYPSFWDDFDSLERIEP
jgi:3-phosphoshikimate 1-carboxyvinyltransferase